MSILKLLVYQFTAGQEYVVVAGRNGKGKGEIEIAPCSSTIWMVHVPDFAGSEFRLEAAEAVAFVASLRQPAVGGRIFGEVRVLVRDPFSGGIKRRSRRRRDSHPPGSGTKARDDRRRRPVRVHRPIARHL